MRKEQITDKEGICLIITFTIGSTLILGIGGEAKNDAWIAGITAILMVLPMIFVYSRILSLFHGKDLFEILDIALGKVIGKIIAILYIVYAFHLGALVIRNFGEFVNTVAMPETPMLVPMLFLCLCCVTNVKSGIEVMGRMSASILPIVIIILSIILIFAFPLFNMGNIKPILGHGIVPVLKGGFSAFSFPFAETVLLTGAFFSLKTKKSTYKVYFSGILIAGLLIVVLTTRNILILGDLLGRLYFPSHVAVSRISIGDFLQRVEVTVAFVFIVGTFIKASVCLFVACKGISKVLKLHDYRTTVIQTGLLMTYFAYSLYDNIMEMQSWAFQVYPYYAFPFQMIIPLIVWGLAELKVRKRSRS